MNVKYNKINNETILHRQPEEQIMMEWEKGYMEACIDFLEPYGDILEIGWGCGYSATQFMKYPLKSYTVIECEPVVIEKAKEWAKNYDNVTIIEGTWQEKLHSLGKFDCVFFDDYPLNITKESSKIDIAISNTRISIFLDLIIQNHTKVGSKISFYLNGNEELTFGTDTEPFVTKKFKTMETKIPDNCLYRDVKEQKVTIPLLTVTKEYNFLEAQRWALEQIKKNK